MRNYNIAWFKITIYGANSVYGNYSFYAHFVQRIDVCPIVDFVWRIGMIQTVSRKESYFFFIYSSNLQRWSDSIWRSQAQLLRILEEALKACSSDDRDFNLLQNLQPARQFSGKILWQIYG